jgi:hypothetical protein
MWKGIAEESPLGQKAKKDKTIVYTKHEMATTLINKHTFFLSSSLNISQNVLNANMTSPGIFLLILRLL